MNKIELRVLGLSYSQTQVGSYVVVLSEVDGARKIPIIVKPADAQTIALKIENMKTQRPLTHDLLKSMTDAFCIDIQEVYIFNLIEGVFYAKLIASDGKLDSEIESTIGDAISLALVYDCPIYVSQHVMDSSGIYINDDGTSMTQEEIDQTESSKSKPIKSEKKSLTIDDLEDMLNRAVSNEEYEVASKLRDRIKELKGE